MWATRQKSKTKKKNDTRRIEKVSVIEGCYNSGKVNHIHSIVEIPEHLSHEEFELMIKKSHGSFYKSQNLTNWLRNQNGSDVVNKMGNPERVKPYSEPLRNLHTKKKKYKLKPQFANVYFYFIYSLPNQHRKKMFYTISNHIISLT